MAEYMIAGAGICGLTTAVALRQAGHTVQVFEAAPKLRAMGAGLVLGANTMQALGCLGLAEAVAALGQPVGGLTILDERGTQLLDVDATRVAARRLGPGWHSVALRHAALQSWLLGCLPPGTVHTGKALAHFTKGPNQVQATFEDGTVAAGEALVGADGLHSRVRRQLVPGHSAPRYAGYSCWRAVVDASALNLPDMGRFRETWGRAGRFGYVPVGAGWVYWFCTVRNAVAHDPSLARYGVADLQKIFGQYHHPVAELLRLTRDAQLLWHDIVDLPPLSRYAHGRVLLLGDAAHATTPNLGQGAGQAVEDAVVLGHCSRAQPDLAAVFRAFEQLRLRRTRSIVQRSWRVGKIAHWQHPAAVAVRNAAMRVMPAFVTDWQTRFIYHTRFAGVDGLGFNGKA